MEIYSCTIESPIGTLLLKSNREALLSLSFVDEPVHEENSRPEILERTIVQLAEYFEGERRIFDVSLQPEGTDFQQRVWDLVREVEFGRTKSYGDLATELGSLQYSRAVGLANGSNPIPIIIPCHRIIGSNGKLTGYSGGLERKKWLLLHEQRNSGKTLF